MINRTILSGLLVVASIATAEAIPASSSLAHQTAVSPRMAELIVMYQTVTATLDAIDPRTDTAAWTAAESAWERAQDDLANARPESPADFAAKFDALMGDGTSEYAILKSLSQDAHALAGGCR